MPTRQSCFQQHRGSNTKPPNGMPDVLSQGWVPAPCRVTYARPSGGSSPAPTQQALGRTCALTRCFLGGPRLASPEQFLILSTSARPPRRSPEAALSYVFCAAWAEAMIAPSDARGSTSSSRSSHPGRPIVRCGAANSNVQAPSPNARHGLRQSLGVARGPSGRRDR